MTDDEKFMLAALAEARAAFDAGEIPVGPWLWPGAASSAVATT